MRRAVALCMLLLAGCDDPTVIREAPPPRAELMVFTILDPTRSVQWVHVAPTAWDRELGTVLVELFEDGRSVARATATGSAAGPGPGSPECDRYYGFGFQENAACAALTYWPRSESVYRVEVSAPGWPTAVGQTRIPGAFSLSRGSADGGHLQASWTASAGAEAYFVFVEDTGCNHFLMDCRSGWATYTQERTIDTGVPVLRGAGSEPLLVRVAAVDSPLFQYLTGGATGEHFVVPPVENVEGGRGVVGSWVRRWTVDARLVPVPERGPWTPVSQDSLGRYLQRVAPDPTLPDLFVGRTGLRTGDLVRSRDRGRSWQVILADSVGTEAFAHGAGDTLWAGQRQAVLRSTDHGDTWTTVADLGATVQVVSVGAVTGALYAGVSGAGPGQPLLYRAAPGEALEAVPLPPLPDADVAELIDVLETPDGGILVTGSTGPQRGTGPAFFLRSDDGGATWRDVTGPVQLEVREIVAGPGILYTYTQAWSIYQGIYYSLDQGRTWERSTELVPLGLAVDPVRPDRVFTGFRFNIESGDFRDQGGVFASEARGDRPVRLGLDAVEILDIVVRDGTLYAVTPWGVLGRPVPPMNAGTQ